jgi:hypothetical protein
VKQYDPLQRLSSWAPGPFRFSFWGTPLSPWTLYEVPTMCENLRTQNLHCVCMLDVLFNLLRFFILVLRMELSTHAKHVSYTPSHLGFILLLTEWGKIDRWGDREIILFFNKY